MTQTFIVNVVNVLQRIKDLEQENKELKEKIEAFKTMATVPTRMYNECERERCRYGRALEEIRKLATTGSEQEDCYSCEEIIFKIDEVLQ